MRKSKVKVLGVLLLLCLILSGCSSWKNYFHTEASLKWEAAKALKEKYNEKFLIHGIWVASQTTFKVICSPENNTDIVFEAEIYKDGSGVYVDEYVQSVVSKQITDKLQKELQIYFDDCFIHAVLFYDECYFKDVSNVTIKEYISQIEHAKCLVYVLVDPIKITNNTIKEEYKYFSETLQNEIKSNIMPRITVNFYYTNAELKQWSKDYFQKNFHSTGEYDIATLGCYEFGFGYPENKINKTYEEYKKLRMGVIEVR